jgi:hypothetical protein
VQLASSQTGLGRGFLDSDELPRQFQPTFWSLFALFSVELLALSLVRLPESMRFDGFAFCDHGSNLTLQYLISRGYRPGLDFGYHYGLLPAFIGRIWFALFGARPLSYQGAMVCLNFICAWAVAKIFWELRVSRVGLALTVIALGFAFQATYPNLAHATEAALISLALAKQAQGVLTNALAITSVTVFVKPSMAYVYSLLLVLLIIRDLAKKTSFPSDWITAFAPAAVSFFTIGAILVFEFGIGALFRTAVPIEGATAYRELNFGIFAAGRDLWSSKLGLLYYLLTHAGFWILANLFLYSSAAIQLAKALISGEFPPRRTELVVTCALLHLAFLLLFFGNQFSWIYYSYLLVIGCSIAADFGAYSRLLGVGLCVFALFSWTALGYWTERWWVTTAPSSSTNGLWATDEERHEWEKVLALASQRKVVILDEMGAAELMFPGFRDPVSLFLMRGLMTPADVARKRAQLDAADTVVVPKTMSTCSGIIDEPEFSGALDGFEPIWKTEHFDAFQRHTR